MADPEPVLFRIDGTPVNMVSLGYAVVILLVTALLVVTALLTIAVIVTNELMRDVIGYYFVSLAVSDLFCGLFLTPPALAAALDPQWRYGGDNSVFCKVEAYVGVLLWSSVVYIFMWIGVDRYAALAKPTRYDVEQTFTRCKCWILFTWISSVLLACPILAAEMEARYYPETFLCVLDWGATKAYSGTLASLVLLPSLIGIFYSYWYIFSSIRNPDDLEDTQKAMLESDQTYMMTFFIILSFALSWAPWFILQSVETTTAAHLDVQPLHFSLLWLAIGGGSWKFVIYMIMNREFRYGLGCLWTRICCCGRRRRAPYDDGLPALTPSQYQSLPPHNTPHAY